MADKDKDDVKGSAAVDNSDAGLQNFDVPPAGGDPDSRLRTLKTALGAARTEDEADALNDQIAELEADMPAARARYAEEMDQRRVEGERASGAAVDRNRAATDRQAAAANRGESKLDAQRTPPSGRAAPQRSTTTPDKPVAGDKK